MSPDQQVVVGDEHRDTGVGPPIVVAAFEPRPTDDRWPTSTDPVAR